MDIYLGTKTLHLFFVISWMATVFCLPRILLGLAGAREEPAVRERLTAFGLRIYRLGHILFGLAIALGLVLWLHFRISGPWLHAKLLLVVLMFVLFLLSGIWLKKSAAGRPLPPVGLLLWINGLPPILLVIIIWLSLAKPF